jgi:hypothetical protein
MSKGKDKCVAQGGQPERSAVRRQTGNEAKNPRMARMARMDANRERLVTGLLDFMERRD